MREIKIGVRKKYNYGKERNREDEIRIIKKKSWRKNEAGCQGKMMKYDGVTNSQIFAVNIVASMALLMWCSLEFPIFSFWCFFWVDVIVALKKKYMLWRKNGCYY